MTRFKVVACIIARTVSTRLPLKVLRHLQPGLSMLDFLIQRVKTATRIDEIYICTSVETVDDILEDVAVQNNVKLYRGSPDQVIERMLAVGQLSGADIVLRITGDNPLTAVEYIDTQIQNLETNQLDYIRIIDVPIGATAEVIQLDALKRCNELMDPSVSEYMMLYLFEPKIFRCGVIKAFQDDYSNYTVTVDTPQDLVRTKAVLQKLGLVPEKIFLKDIIALYNNQTEAIPYRTIEPSGVVKLPFDKTISFQEFKEDMNRRVRESMLFTLYNE